MAAILLIGLGSLVFIAIAIHGAVGRIADAIEAQNKHYGIGAEKAAEAPAKEAA